MCFFIKTLLHIFALSLINYLSMNLIKGFPNYIISENGSVTNIRSGRVLKQNKNQKGYLQTQLSNKGISKTKTIHRMVFETFKGRIKKGFEINHIDGNKDNNNLYNLEQVTKKENMVKAVEIGLIKKGKECPLSTPVKMINVITNEVLSEFGSINIASKKTGISSSSISSVSSGKRLTAGGYKWEKI